MTLMMDLHLNDKLAVGYSSNSQKSRVITEGWTKAHMYCPVCGAKHLVHFKDNSPVADFYCDNCGAQFEQKSKESKRSRLPKTVAGGAFSAMEARLKSDQNPHLLVLTYANCEVNNLVLVPRHFFTMSVVEKRKPLGPNARRAGWVGSNILLEEIPDSGKIYIIKNGIEEKQTDVLDLYQRTLPLMTADLTKRGWLLDVLKCVDIIPTSTFSLSDIYAFAAVLQKKHPRNNHVNDKIRQQLQVLRDKGFIEFIGRGKYRKI